MFQIVGSYNKALLVPTVAYPGLPQRADEKKMYILYILWFTNLLILEYKLKPMNIHKNFYFYISQAAYQLKALIQLPIY